MVYQVMIAAALLLAAGGTGLAAGEFDFASAWKEVDAAQAKRLPRTATNVLTRIERAAVAAHREPDAVKAFVMRFNTERTFNDDLKDEWIPALERRVAAAPEEIRPYLDLYLAQVYSQNANVWRWGGRRPTKLTANAAEQQLPAWSPERLPASLETLFARVLSVADRLKTEPVEKWKDVLRKGNMPDRCRPTLYDLAVHYILNFYGGTVPDKSLEKGLRLLDGLIAFHSAAGNGDALADATYRRLEYENNFTELPPKKRLAKRTAALDAFIAAWRDTSEIAALAVCARAEIERNAGRLVAARKMAREGAARWPKSVGGRQCAALVAQIEQPSLSFATERIWAKPLPTIKVTAANLDTAHFKLVKISREEFLAEEYQRDRKRDEYCHRKGVRSWTARLGTFTDYAPHETAVDVPKDVPNGYYLLVAGADGTFTAKGKPFFAAFVQVTDLALVVAHDGGRISGTVFRSEAGTRVADAKVELWGYKKNARKVSVLDSVTTAVDGSFAVSGSGRVCVSAADSEIVSELLSTWIPGESKEVFEKISVITDRAIYRPGQTIHFKGYAHFMNRGKRDFRVLPGVRIELDLLDPNGKSVGGWAALANEWGTFVGSFTAPRDRLTGWYQITARIQGTAARSSTSLRVEEYKRPKFTVELGQAPSDAALGREIELVGTAKTYSGLPVAGAKVKWTADRATQYPYWFRWFNLDDDDGDNQVAQGEVTADENGAFRIRFTPTADPKADLDGEPSFGFTVKADVTDTTGETRSSVSRIEIGTVAWRARVAASVALASAAPAKVRVDLTSLDGPMVSAKGLLHVYALKGPASPVRKPADGWGWYGYRNRRTKKAEVRPWDWKTWDEGDEVKTLPVDVKDGAWTGELALPAGAYRLRFETKDPQGRRVRGEDAVAVCDFASEKLGFAAPSYFAAECQENTVKVGTHLRYVWASGYRAGTGRMEIFSNGKRVFVRESDAATPFLFADYEVKEADRGQIECRVSFFREGRYYTDRAVTNVAWDNMNLSIEREHFTSKLETGAKEKWTFRVSGPSEVLAFMYDRSLDAYAPHGVFSPFGDYSVRIPFLPWYQTVNGVVQLNQVSGSFPYSSWPPRPVWRTLNDLFNSYSSFERYRAVRGLAAPVACGKMRACAMQACRAPQAALKPVCDSVAPSAEAPMADMKAKGRSRSRAESGGDVPPEPKVRTNLAETAFFLPHLVTDADGRVAIAFTAPEAISGWKLQLLAHDKALKCGILRDDTVTTTRPLMVEPNPPRFVREGDDFTFAVKVTNNTDEPQKATVSLDFEDLESGARAAVGGGKESVALKPHETKAVAFAVKIPDGQGFLKFVAKAAGAKFADGEEGALAVLARRIEVREAVQLNLRGAGEKRFALTNLLESVKKGNTIRNVDLTVRVVSRPAWYAVTSLPYLMEFPHECCEQTFSRYYANALGEFLAKSDPRIRATFDAWKAVGADALKSPLERNADLKQIALDATPWVCEAAHETAAKRRLGELFDAKRMAGEHERCLAKLANAITPEGLFPWFPGGPGSEGISLYILVGVERLNRLCGIRRPDFTARVLRTVDARERDDVAARLRRAREGKYVFHVTGYDLRWLYLHSFRGVAEGDAATVKVLMDHLRREWTDFGVEGAALAAIVLNRAGDRATAMDVVRSLKERAVVSEEFGMYWKRSPFFSSSVFAAPVSTQATVVEAFKEVAKDSEAVDACNVWILKQKQTQNWSSTAATVDAIYAILLGGGTDLLAGDTLATVALGDTEVPRTNVEKGTGTYSASWRGGAITSEMGAITLRNEAPKGVVWGGVNWTYLEDVEKVRAFEPKELRIEKRYFRKIRTKEGTRLEPVAGVLEQGDELVARLRLRCDRTLEYVHIKDERPSCAEPVDVLSRYRWQDGVGYYQSTRDTATHYYLDRLNKGEFVLETSYRVQQRGTFTGGLAQIQCMYAPEFTSHSTAERIEVK